MRPECLASNGVVMWTSALIQCEAKNTQRLAEISCFLSKVQIMTPISTGVISKRAERCGGDACIRDLRIPVWAVVNYRRLGATDAEILQAYPSLQPSDLMAAFAYAAAHGDEIDAAIRRNEEEDEGVEG
jgi:uncharacterized protein (DUF433 family)